MPIALERGLPEEQVHHRVQLAHRERRTAERALAFYLREVRDRRLFQTFGFADVFHYARSEADLTSRQTRELLRVADALETLPRLAHAYATAALPWSSVREICRVATPETEAAWIEEASRLSCRAVETLVARSRFGDSPKEARERKNGEGMGMESTPLVLHVRPEIKAAFEEALREALRAVGGESVEEALLFMVERTLEGAEAEEEPKEPECERPRGESEGPRFRTVLYKCGACGGTTIGKDGEVASPSVEARAECDGEVVDLNEGGKASKTVPPRVRRAVLLRDGHQCVVPGCTNRLWVEVHHVVPKAEGGDHDPSNLRTLCSRHHGLVHEGWVRAARGEDGRLRWFARTGREIGRRTTHVGRGSRVERLSGLTAAGVVANSA